MAGKEKLKDIWAQTDKSQINAMKKKCPQFSAAPKNDSSSDTTVESDSDSDSDFSALPEEFRPNLNVETLTLNEKGNDQVSPAQTLRESASSPISSSQKALGNATLGNGTVNKRIEDWNLKEKTNHPSKNFVVSSNISRKMHRSEKKDESVVRSIVNTPLNESKKKAIQYEYVQRQNLFQEPQLIRMKVDVRSTRDDTTFHAQEKGVKYEIHLNQNASVGFKKLPDVNGRVSKQKFRKKRRYYSKGDFPSSSETSNIKWDDSLSLEPEQNGKIKWSYVEIEKRVSVETFADHSKNVEKEYITRNKSSNESKNFRKFHNFQSIESSNGHNSRCSSTPSPTAKNDRFRTKDDKSSIEFSSEENNLHCANGSKIKFVYLNEQDFKEKEIQDHDEFNNFRPIENRNGHNSRWNSTRCPTAKNDRFRTKDDKNSIEFSSKKNNLHCANESKIKFVYLNEQDFKEKEIQDHDEFNNFRPIENRNGHNSRWNSTHCPTAKNDRFKMKDDKNSTEFFSKENNLHSTNESQIKSFNETMQYFREKEIQDQNKFHNFRPIERTSDHSSRFSSTRCPTANNDRLRMKDDKNSTDFFSEENNLHSASESKIKYVYLREQDFKEKENPDQNKTYAKDYINNYKKQNIDDVFNRSALNETINSPCACSRKLTNNILQNEDCAHIQDRKAANKPSENIEEQRNCILHYGKEMSDLIIGSYTALSMLVSFYRDWTVARRELLTIFKQLEKNLQESSKSFSRYADIIKVANSGAVLATTIPHAAVAIPAKIVSIITSLLQTLLKSKEDQSKVDDSDKVTEAMTKDTQSTSELHMYVLQCSQQFEETTKFIREFHSDLKIQTYLDNENPEITTFMKGFLEYKPDHRIFYKKLHKCLSELLQTSSTSLSKSFCEPFTFYTSATDVIEYLNWRFRYEDFDSTSVNHELEAISRLMGNANDITIADLHKRIRNCIRILEEELEFRERCMKDISLFDTCTFSKKLF